MAASIGSALRLKLSLEISNVSEYINDYRDIEFVFLILVQKRCLKTEYFF